LPAEKGRRVRPFLLFDAASVRDCVPHLVVQAASNGRSPVWCAAALRLRKINVIIILHVPVANKANTRVKLHQNDILI
jgi:hypothetical protein